MHLLNTPFLASLGETPSMEEVVHSSESLIVGFVFVIGLLGLLAGLTSLIGVYFTRRELAALKAAAAERESAGAPASATPVAAAPTPQTEIAEEDIHLLPVVAAAIHTVFGDRPHRVVSIKPARSGWAQEGRREIFSGRRVR